MASKAYEIAFKLGAKMDKSYGSTFDKAEGIASKTVTTIKRTLAGLAAVVISFSAVQGAVDEAMKFESAMADVAKVVDGLKDETGKTTDAYAVMSNEILDMTARLPMAAEDITKLIAAAGQSGIAADELTRFAEDAAKMGVAFDLPAERAGELAAVIRSSLGMTQDEFVTLADKINFFGNTTTQSADKIIEVVEATGLIGQQAGVSADQIAAMSAAMTGMDASNMGTALSNIYGSLMMGTGATKNAQSAWKSLGFTSEQVAKSMLEDSEGTMMQVFAAMQNLPADQLAATTAAIFGNNKSTKMAIASFTANLDQLEANFTSIGDAAVYAGSMQNEFNSRAATTENTIQLAKNAIDRLQITLGSLLLPVVAKGATLFANAMTSLSGKIPALIDNLKALAGNIVSALNLDTFYEGLAPKLPAIQENAKIFVTNFMSGVARFLKGESLASALSDSMSGIQGILQTILGDEKGSMVFEGVRQGLERISGVIDTVKSAMIMIAPAAKDFLSVLINLGTSIAPIMTKLHGAFMSFLPVILSVFQKLIGPIGNLVSKIGEALQILMPIFASIFGFIIDNIVPVAMVVFENLGKVVATVVDVIANTLPIIATVLGVVWGIAQPILQAIMNVVQFVFGFISGFIASAVEAIGGYINNVLLVFHGVIDFLTGVFTGNWQQAWQGIQDIFSGIFGALSSIVKAPLNAVISIINGAISGINSINITIPDWVPLLGGKNFGVNIPQIPMLAKGSQNAPDTFIAGEQGPELITGAAGSKVFTAGQTSGIFDRLAQMVSNIGQYNNLESPQNESPFSLRSGGSEGFTGSPLEITYSPQIKVEGSGMDEGALRAMIEAILRGNLAEFEQIVRDILDDIKSREERLANA